MLPNSQKALNIAINYNWEPEYSNEAVACDLRNDTTPAGFGTLVGKTIALFARPSPFPEHWFLSEDQLHQNRAQDAEHKRILCELRVLIAKINTARAV